MKLRQQKGVQSVLCLQKHLKYYREDIRSQSNKINKNSNNLANQANSKQIKDLDSLIPHLLQNQSASSSKNILKSPAKFRKKPEPLMALPLSNKTHVRSGSIKQLLVSHQRQPKSNDSLGQDSATILSANRPIAETENSKHLRQYLRSVVQRYRLATRSSKKSVFEEFTDLCRESHDYLDFYLKRIKATQFSQLQEFIHSKNNNIILCILREHYPVFSQSTKSRRILIGLDINPLDDFSKIDWAKFNRIRKLTSQKDLDVIESARLLTKLFFPDRQNQFISKEQFKRVLKSLIQKLDVKLHKLNVKTPSECVMELIEPYFRQGDDIGKSQKAQLSRDLFKQLILEQKVLSYTDFISLIFDSFQI